MNSVFLVTLCIDNTARDILGIFNNYDEVAAGIDVYGKPVNIVTYSDDGLVSKTFVYTGFEIDIEEVALNRWMLESQETREYLDKLLGDKK